MSDKPMANDTVLHIPSGETWVVCGVNKDGCTLIPCGYPFPTIAKVKDCIVISKSNEPQNNEQKAALRKHNLDNYLEV